MTSIEKLLTTALAIVRSALDVKTGRSYSRVMMEVTVPAAFSGIPLTPDMFVNLMLKPAIKALKKAAREFEKNDMIDLAYEVKYVVKCIEDGRLREAEQRLREIISALNTLV